MKDKEKNTILLKDYLTPEHAANLQANITDSLDEYQTTVLDADGIENLGSVQLQIVIASVARANELGVTLMWSNLPKALSDKAHLMGLSPHLAFNETAGV